MIKKSFTLFILLFLFCSCSSIYSTDKYLEIKEKVYNLNTDTLFLGEKQLVGIINYYFEFDKEGFITYYKKTSTYNGNRERLDIEYIITKNGDIDYFISESAKYE